MGTGTGLGLDFGNGNGNDEGHEGGGGRRTKLVAGKASPPPATTTTTPAPAPAPVPRERIWGYPAPSAPFPPKATRAPKPKAAPKPKVAPKAVPKTKATTKLVADEAVDDGDGGSGDEGDEGSGNGGRPMRGNGSPLPPIGRSMLRIFGEDHGIPPDERRAAFNNLPHEERDDYKSIYAGEKRTQDKARREWEERHPDKMTDLARIRAARAERDARKRQNGAAAVVASSGPGAAHVGGGGASAPTTAPKAKAPKAKTATTTTAVNGGETDDVSSVRRDVAAAVAATFASAEFRATMRHVDAHDVKTVEVVTQGVTRALLASGVLVFVDRATGKTFIPSTRARDLVEASFMRDGEGLVDGDGADAAGAPDAAPRHRPVAKKTRLMAEGSVDVGDVDSADSADVPRVVVASSADPESSESGDDDDDEESESGSGDDDDDGSSASESASGSASAHSLASGAKPRIKTVTTHAKKVVHFPEGDDDEEL